MDIAKTEVHGQVNHLLFRDDIYVARNMDLLLSWIMVDAVLSMHDEGEGIVHCC